MMVELYLFSQIEKIHPDSIHKEAKIMRRYRRFMGWLWNKWKKENDIKDKDAYSKSREYNTWLLEKASSRGYKVQ